MDDVWALDKLREFQQLAAVSVAENPWLTGEADEAAIISRAQTVEKILDVVVPRWRQDVPQQKSRQWRQHHDAALRAIAEIEDSEIVAEKLGEVAPTLLANAMHPWAWEGARSLWQSGHYAEAVRAAATKLNAETQNKVGRRDISEGALFQLIFGDNSATPDAPRLRPIGDDDGKTAKSVRRGVALLAEGCFAAIRNPVSHAPVELSEQLALEQLAVVSLVSRLVDESTVVHG